MQSGCDVSNPSNKKRKLAEGVHYVYDDAEDVYYLGSSRVSIINPCDHSDKDLPMVDCVVVEAKCDSDMTGNNYPNVYLDNRTGLFHGMLKRWDNGKRVTKTVPPMRCKYACHLAMEKLRANWDVEFAAQPKRYAKSSFANVHWRPGAGGRWVGRIPLAGASRCEMTTDEFAFEDEYACHVATERLRLDLGCCANNDEFEFSGVRLVLKGCALEAAE